MAFLLRLYVKLSLLSFLMHEKGRLKKAAKSSSENELCRRS